MNPELLNPHETNPSSREESLRESAPSAEDFERLYAERCGILENLRSVISLDFYLSIRRKLEEEKKAFLRLQAWEDAKEEALAEYSFVLNPAYFEQKFLE